jgi:hypothetical protein
MNWRRSVNAAPGDQDPVLARLSNGVYVIGHLNKGTWIHTFDGAPLRLPVTHWMPLPDPPLTGEDQ